MARLNTESALRADAPRTHEGAVADRMTPPEMLRRTIATCLLWEDTFYEDGENIADRIGYLVERCTPAECSEIAIEARERMHIRHAPLLVCAHMARAHGGMVTGDTIARVIQRPDELAELVAIVGKINQLPPNGTGKLSVKKALSSQMKRGLAVAFTKFDEYQLAKYDRKGAVTLRDVLFLSHAKPKDADQEALWKRLVDGKLATPDTWETRLSRGEDKRESFDQLLREGKLGYMALLRNLRNMEMAGVDRSLVADAIRARKGAKRVLPIRFLSAYRAAPSFAQPLADAMLASVQDIPRLSGNTAVIVDVSGSMGVPISERSLLSRMDVAAALGALVSGDTRMFVFGSDVAEVPSFKGLPGIEAVVNANGYSDGNRPTTLHGQLPVGHATDMGKALRMVHRWAPESTRIIMVSDMQTMSALPPLGNATGYAINVAPYKNGVAFHGGWTHISGWSDNVLRYIREVEGLDG